MEVFFTKIISFKRNLYLFGLIILIAAIPTSNYMMSVSQMVLGVAWLLEGNFKERLKQLLTNRFFWAIFSIFFLHLIGLIHTSDFIYAWKDLRTKLPLFVLPFIIFSMPILSHQESRFLIWIHAATLAVTALIGLFLGLKEEFINYRFFSPGISHIRFSLNICLSIVLLFYETHQQKNWKKKTPGLIFIILFFLYLILFGATTGSLISVFLLIAWTLYSLAKKLPLWITILIWILSSGVILFGIYSIDQKLEEIKNYKPICDLSQLPATTSRGNPYLHDTLYFGKENGNWVGLYYCEKELVESWSKRSELDFYGKDLCGQPLMATIVRYLNSKGLTKDADGLAKLSDEEIRNIEKGVANADQLARNAFARALGEFYFGYEKYLDGYGTQGNSIMQRYELIKASINIIKKSPLTGVGTGDIPQVFHNQLVEMNSDLKNTRLRSHNQFLSITIGFGIPGLLFFLITLFYPSIHSRFDFRLTAFTFIVFISMLNEDTIETQAGVTFFAFFMTFLSMLAKETSKPIAS